ncbi:MAG: ABC transporter ATP-binding protein [Cyanobacteria bacterium J055]|nr:MAG: ABC transporter ATP-binding protein [Cyanobacteria bacterium J055]
MPSSKTSYSTETKTKLRDVFANTPRIINLVWKAIPRLFIVSIALTLIIAAIPPIELYVNKLVVDFVVNSIGKPSIVWKTLGLLLTFRISLGLGKEALNQINFYIKMLVRDSCLVHTENALLEQAIRLDLAHYELPAFYDTLKRAQEGGSNYPVMVLESLTRMFGQIVSFAGLLVLLLRFNVGIMLLLLLSVLPTLFVSLRFSKLHFWMKRHQTQSWRMAHYLQDVMTENEFAKEVRLFDLGNYLLQRWQTIRYQFNREFAQLTRRQSSVSGVAQVLTNVGFYAAYGWAILKTVRGQISLGDFTMYTGAFEQSQGLLQGILESFSHVYEFNLYVSQYFDFLNLKPQVLNPNNPRSFPNPLQSGLELKNVSFTYPGASKPTLKNINLTVKPGESIALVGINGAGKTTLLKLLTRLYDIDSGEITFDGIRIDRLDLQDLRRNIGIIFQDFARYNLTAQDNIGFGNLPELENLSLIDRAADNAGAKPTISGLESGYQTVLGKVFDGGTDLSGGQWQKIGLARAFTIAAPILILDEPTAALDAIAEYELFQKFRQLTKGKMTFFVSLRFSTVLLADRIVVLDNSQIVEVGSHEELMTKDGLYAQMFRLQASSYNG